jgi:hypothetical protein
VAENRIKGSTFDIENSKTGEQFTVTNGLPLDADFRVESPYNEWKILE